jgi:hypothetical protein
VREPARVIICPHHLDSERRRVVHHHSLARVKAGSIKDRYSSPQHDSQVALLECSAEGLDRRLRELGQTLTRAALNLRRCPTVEAAHRRPSNRR